MSLSFKKVPLLRHVLRARNCAPSVFKRKLREKHERDKTWKKINEGRTKRKSEPTRKRWRERDVMPRDVYELARARKEICASFEKIYVHIVPVVNSYPICYSSRISNSLESSARSLARSTGTIDSRETRSSDEFARKCAWEIADRQLTRAEICNIF